MIVAPETATQTGATDDHLAGLLPHHLQELRASGLSNETIRAAGIRSETDKVQLSVILGWRKYPQKMGPAIVYPFQRPEGNSVYVRIKPDIPRQTTNGKSIKYESPKGQPNEVYFPPGTISVLNDATVELLLTEGEKKSLAADQLGFRCLGLVGVFGWKDKRGERLLPSLERLAWGGRRVFIVFDSDIERNQNVQEAECRLAKQLQARGAIVRCVRLPDAAPADDGKPVKQGLDDYLVAHGKDAARALREALNKSTDPAAPSAIVTRESGKLLDPGTEAECYLSRDKQDGLYRLRYWRGSFILFRDGCYQEVSSAEVRADVVQFLKLSYSELSSTIINNVMDHIRAESILASRIEPPTWLDDKSSWKPVDVIATKNELVHLPSFIDRGEYLLPRTPRFFATSAIGYRFDPSVTNPIAWQSFLQQLWPDDAQSIDTLQEWFGYVLTNNTSLQKMLMLVGPKRSGKGTIARILTAMIGPNNVAGPTMSSLGDRFGLWPLLGKSLAIFNDARLSGRADQAVIVERLLSISGEDRQTIDRKGIEPVTAKLTTRLMIVSNELPRLTDSSGALVGRLVLLQIERSFFGQEDTGLLEKLLPEVPGILLWAIEGWRRLRARGRFEQPNTSLELLGEMNDLASPMAQFVRERCVVSAGHWTAIEELYREWCDWCLQTGRREPGTVQTFGRDLHAVVPGLRQTRPRSAGDRRRGYEGIGLLS